MSATKRKPSGPVRRAASAVIILLMTGCGSPESPPATPINDVDVMFLQMGLAQIAEGDKVLTLAEQRAANPALRAIATELRGQWHSESGTMERWLLGWSKPVTVDPSAEAHAGHGDLHALRDADFGELAAAQGAGFDRTAVSLLLGTLHNGMETLLMESSGGAYPPAKDLATRMTVTRQAQIQRLLKIAAAGG
ncbi:DUF305 domain-containing protein [Actinoplanes palleronii]